MKNNRLHNVWYQMRYRCNTHTCKDFRYYGGKGIKVDWSDYLAFETWALSNGYEDHLTIDRIDSDGNYCSENCRWATRAVQSRHSPKAVIRDDGVRYPSQRAAAKDLKIHEAAIANAIRGATKTAARYSWRRV